MRSAALATLATLRGDWPRSRELHEEALRIERALGEEWSVAHTLANLAHATMTLADSPRMASKLYEEAIEIFTRGSGITTAWRGARSDSPRRSTMPATMTARAAFSPRACREWR